MLKKQHNMNQHCRDYLLPTKSVTLSLYSKITFAIQHWSHLHAATT